MHFDPRGSSLMAGTAYLNQPADDANYILDKVLPVGGSMNIYGAPKSRKSYAAIGLAAAISGGVAHWLGIPIRKHGPVAYFQFDTPRSEWQERLKAMRDGGLDVSGIAFGDKTMAPLPFDILKGEHQTWMNRGLEEFRPIVVIIDTLREIYDGDENDSKEQKKVIAMLDALLRPYNAAMVLISHSRKDNPMAPRDLMGDQRGTSYLPGRMDSVMRVIWPEDKNQGTLMYQGRAVGYTQIKLEMNEHRVITRAGVQELERAEAVKQVLAQMKGKATLAEMQRELYRLAQVPPATAWRLLKAELGSNYKVGE